MPIAGGLNPLPPGEEKIPFYETITFNIDI
jgi:hypothetical protein